MTKQDALDAFARGDIDRRNFIGRLTALGISAGAAAAYALSFAPGVSASGSRNDAGFLISAQGATSDEEYATACTYDSDDDAVTALLGVSTDVRTVLSALDGFTADDFDAGVFDLLTTIATQQDDQADAIAALTGGSADDSGAAETYESADEFLSALSDALNGLVASLAGVGPALQDGESAQTVANIAIVVGGQASLVNLFAGNDPLPETFLLPSCPV